jgi:hypothetical protein
VRVWVKTARQQGIIFSVVYSHAERRREAAYTVATVTV